jgi:hypothetical protein
VVFTMEPLAIPALQIGLERKGEEILIGVSLYTNSANYLAVGGTRLILQEEIVFEKCEIRGIVR